MTTRRALEALFGPSRAPAPVLHFLGPDAGSVFVTGTLVESPGQQRNKIWPRYELMICSRTDDPDAVALLRRLAPYTLQTPLNLGETLDLESPPAGSTITSLLFTTPSVPLPFTVDGLQAGIVLCVGITEAELRFRWETDDPDALLRKLKDAGVFPYTDWTRPSVV